MAIVLTSTTSSQEEMNRVVSAEGDEWRKPPVIEEPKPDVEETKADAPESVDSESAKEADKGTEAKPDQPKKEHRKPSAKEQARIDELTKKWRESERKEKAKDAEIEALKRRMAIGNGEILEDEPLTEPNWKEMEAQGKTHDEYVLHLRAWDEAQRRFESERQQKLNYITNKYKDWDAVLKKAEESGIRYADKQVETAVNKAIAKQSAEMRGEINYYLLSNLDDARVLTNLTPYEAGLYIAKLAGKLESKLAETSNAATPPPTPKPKVKPPEPIAPVGTASTRETMSIWDDRFPVKKMIEIRNKELAQKRGR